MQIKSKILTIIFSKDRPMQLDCLVRSVQKNCPELSNMGVITKATHDDYKRGYALIKGAKIFYERTIKHTLLRLFEITSSEYICFMVDDDIVFRTVDKIVYPTEPKTVFSLRLGENIKHKIHLGYQMSVDGHIFYRKDILPLIQKANFKDPNQLEGELCKSRKGWKIIYDKQCLVGIPHNRVSDSSGCTYTNKYSTKELCDMFLNNRHIDFEAMNFSGINNVHANIDYKFKKY